jgi:hypothetical protein
MGGVFGGITVPAKYQPTVIAAAARYGVPPTLLAAQLNAESGFNPSAVSPDGAIGIAQFLPGTAAEVGIDPHNATDSINAMAKLMASYKSRFGSWQKALYAYHDGPNAVDHPGPAGIKYAADVLSNVSDTDTSAPVITTPVGFDPFKPLENSFARATSSAFWLRVAYYIFGTVLVVVGISFLFFAGGDGIVKKGVSSVGKKLAVSRTPADGG